MSSTLEQARSLFLEGVGRFEAGRLDEAEARFTAAWRLVPNRPSVLTNLGVVKVLRGHFAEALPLLQQALAQEPDNLEALLHRAIALAELDRPLEALADADRVLALKPELGKAWGVRGRLLKELGRPQQAVPALERAIELGSEVALNRYVLAGLEGGQAPPAPPQAYVENLFDGYAEGFESHLVEVLEYRGPQRLLQPLQQQGRSFERALDLGCGTGLCGPWLRPMARWVAGVDLSQRMLDQADRRGCYDELARGELVQHLRQARPPWDLVVAADVFVYVGELEPVFAALAPLMPRGGVFCFSVEESTGQDLALRPSLRYAHSEASVRGLADEQGFDVQDCQRAPIRQDQGEPVAGIYFWLTRR